MTAAPGVSETYGSAFDNGHAVDIAHLLHIVVVVVTVVFCPLCTVIGGGAGG